MIALSLSTPFSPTEEGIQECKWKCTFKKTFLYFSIFSMISNWHTPQKWLSPMSGHNILVENQDSHPSPAATFLPQNSRGQQPGSQVLKGWACWPLNWTYQMPIPKGPTESPCPCSVTPGPQRIHFPTASALLPKLPEALMISYGNFKKAPLLSTY